MRLADVLKISTFGALLALSGCDDEGKDSGDGSGTGGDRVATVLGLTGDAAAGETVFEAELCSSAACHNTQGQGNGSDDLTILMNTAPMAEDQTIITSLLNGKGLMTPSAHLDDQELADVLAWLRATFP